MKSVYSFFLFCALTTILFCSKTYAEEISWMTNYPQALQQAQADSKPIVLFFTGSDFCPACQHVDREILKSSDFIHAIKDKFIFVKLDFPMRTKLDFKTAAQNEQLKNKYQVDKLPTFIVIDGNEKIIAKVPYPKEGAQKFTKDLLQIRSTVAPR